MIQLMDLAEFSQRLGRGLDMLKQGYRKN